MFSAAKEILREEFSFLSKYPVLNKATSENETCISGYLYNEITGITFEHDGLLCEQLLDFLLNKLQKNSNNVKLKVLKLLLYLVKNGHHHFKKELRRKDYVIKEACCAHGPPDIIYGNEPYLLIRNTAKEILDELYSETTFSNESLESKENKMVLSGYGSSASIGKMHGFGNTFQTSENVREKMAKGISSVMDKLLVEDKNPKLQNEFLTEGFLQYQPVTIEHHGYENSAESVSSELKKEQQNTLTKPKIQRKHMPGKAGGGWDDDDYKENQDSKDIIAESNTSKDSLDRTEPLSQADCTEEQKVVEQFTHLSACFPPTFTEIIEARKQCSYLNCDKIIDLLSQKFQLPETDVKMRCLVLLETLLHHDIISIEVVNKVFMDKLETSANSEDESPVKIKTEVNH
ncbi:AP-4 complex accessory subunit tepsin-like isoform X2 [Centruroides vittatus]|uniref:AP-4 complex accessory subunit tepsin-like isoform X2 n=1 Tax=Centruroides vittatus TaxID=120091 RepID=UPI00350F6888